MGASLNSIFMQSQVHSAGGAAPGESVERGDARDDRQAAANERPCAKRGTPGTAASQTTQKRRVQSVLKKTAGRAGSEWAGV
jgi:hypothetical protein